MSDHIRISGIRAFGHHGVFDHERVEGQEFSVDVTLYVDASKAASTDDLADAVDYGAVATTVHDLVSGAPVNLIETLADRIATALMAIDEVGRVVVTVHKPQAPIPVPFDDVSITVDRP